MAFENQEQLWRHLLAGGKIQPVVSRVQNDPLYFFLCGGFVVSNTGGFTVVNHDPSLWMPFQQPLMDHSTPTLGVLPEDAPCSWKSSALSYSPCLRDTSFKMTYTNVTFASD